MKKEINQIINIINKEAEWALEHHGPFHSRHEAWAVAKEELEEVQYEMCNIQATIGAIWHGIKEDRSNDCMTERIADARNFALKAIAELIQFAAMLNKFKILEGGVEPKELCSDCKHDGGDFDEACTNCVKTLEGHKTRFEKNEED